MNNQHASEELRDQHETWLTNEMTIRLKVAIENKKYALLKQLAKASPDGDIKRIRVLGGQIMGLETVELLIKEAIL